MNHRALTLLILQLNKLVDSGIYDDVTISEVHQHIDDGTILRFLRTRAERYIDLSTHLDPGAWGDFESFYVKHLQSIYDAYACDEERKWGVRNKGLCLLVAWTNEILQQGKGWRPKKTVSERPPKSHATSPENVPPPAGQGNGKRKGGKRKRKGG
jgi:hypothetical protein